jgi:VanZ family protein
MEKLFQQKKLFVALFWIWGIIVFILSSIPNIPTQKLNIWDEPFRLDYLEHFGVFAILGAFFVVWKSDMSCKLDRKKYLFPFLGIILFAVLDETHQLWVDGRTFNPLDMFYNILGLLAAYYLGPFILAWFCKKSVSS